MRYQLRFFRNAQNLPPGGHPVATFLGQIPHSHGARRIVVDFAGGGLGDLPAHSPVHAKFTLGSGAQLLHATVHLNTKDHQWQVAATILPAQHHPSNIRLFLESQGHVLSDTWTYLLHHSKESSHVQKS